MHSYWAAAAAAVSEIAIAVPCKPRRTKRLVDAGLTTMIGASQSDHEWVCPWIGRPAGTHAFDELAIRIRSPLKSSPRLRFRAQTKVRSNGKDGGVEFLRGINGTSRGGAIAH
jgi:hypothetical protein